MATYYYAKLYDAEERTVKAETELSGLQNKIYYWAGRTDRNYYDVLEAAQVIVTNAQQNPGKVAMSLYYNILLPPGIVCV